MKRFLIAILPFLAMSYSYARADTGSIAVFGDFDKFYPVTWTDGGWNDHAASELEIGRSDVHENSQWRGALIAKFTYHVTNGGHGANFINADINSSIVQFVGGWRDATALSSYNKTVIWLRGGGTTYHYKTNYAVAAVIYDGVQNPLPFQETGGPAHSYKNIPDSYVNPAGISIGGAAYFNGNGVNYFAGNIGIGTVSPNGYKLAVQGNVHAQEVVVDINNWPDYVFKKDYTLTPLADLKAYINQNQHLPEIPSEKEITEQGLNLGEMNKLLIKKIEELTLYLIEKDKQLSELNDKRQAEIKAQNNINQQLINQLDEIKRQVNKLKDVKK